MRSRWALARAALILGTRHFGQNGMVEAVALHSTTLRSHHFRAILIGTEIAQ
jgi:hypothetical protein